MKLRRHDRHSAALVARRDFLMAAGAAAVAGPLLWATAGSGRRGADSAAGEAAADDTAAIRKLLEQSAKSGIPVDTGDKIYAIRGDVRIVGATAPRIRSLRLRQLAPSADRRTLHFENCNGIRIDALEIDRGEGKSIGEPSAAAGLWIDGGSGHNIANVSVFGDGIGNGIAISNTSASSFHNLHVSNMQYDSPTATDDLMQGMWLNDTTDCTLSAARVSNLSGNADQHFPNRFTRGIAAGGNLRLKIIGPDIRSVDQGIDLTGSSGNRECRVSGGRTVNCTNVGVKLANSAVNCIITDHVSIGAGMFGFLASGPSEPHLPWKTHNCDFVRCTAINPGANHFPFPRRPPNGPCGFAIWTGDYDFSFPAGIRFIDCSAIDRVTESSMRYGYYSALQGYGSGGGNQLINCRSEGQMLGMSGGLWA